MRAQVVTVSNPLQPHASRSVMEIRHRSSIRELAPNTVRPFICMLNGQHVMRSDWDRFLEDGDMLGFVTLVQGGGQGGSNPVATVAMIAVMVYAPELAPALGFAAGTTAATLITAGVEIASAMLVNALFGPPIPPKAGMLPTPSPTYTLSAQGNVSRLGDPIPCHFGRMRVYPSYAAEPYTEYAGNNQYLYQLFCLGHGSFSIESINILTTPIANFPGIDYEVVQPGGSVTLFPANVVTSGLVTGQELLTPNIPGAPPDCTQGPYMANAPATQTNAIAIDIVLPRGLFYANDAGGLDPRTCTWLVEAQLVDDNSVALGAWITLGNQVLTLATNTPQRISYRYPVTLGRYQVRVTRTNLKDLSSRAGNDLVWAGMRAYLPGSQQYGDVTLIAMRMLATNTLSSASSQKINIIATRMLPSWNPVTGWSAPAATRSIAWALAECCKATYSAELPDTRIDLNALHQLDQTWSARGDYFDGVYDTRTTFWQALTQIARAGRAKPYPQAGIYHFVRDQVQSMPVAMFSPRNMVRGSFKSNYLMPTEQTPDAVQVQYIDSTTWLPNTVLSQLPGSTASRPAILPLFGVTDRNHAWREGMYEAACNRYRRKLPQFQTEMEGFIPSFGDLIAVSHDMPQWGQSGEVLSVSGLAIIGGVVTASGEISLSLSEPLVYISGAQHYIAFRRINGSMSGPWTCSEGPDPLTVILSQTPDIIPYTGSSQERTHFTFGPGQSYAQSALVRSVRPRNEHIVEIMAVNDDPAVHTADQTGSAPAGPTQWLLASTPSAPTITGLHVAVSGTLLNPVISASWNAAPGADHYLVQQSADGVAWTNVGEPSSANTSFNVQPGKIYLRIAAVGLTVGQWVAWSGITGVDAPVSDVQNLATIYKEGLSNLIWDALSDARAVDYEIRLGSTFSSAQVLGRTPLTHFATVGDGTYWVVGHFTTSSGNNLFSPTPGSVTISGSTLVNNVIAIYDEASLGWTGSLSGGATMQGSNIVLGGAGNILSDSDILSEPDVIWYGGVTASGEYDLPAAHTVNIGRVAPCSVMIAYTAIGRSIYDNVLLIPDILQIADVIGEVLGAQIGISPQIALAQADGIFGAWQKFIPGTYSAQHFKARVLLTTTDPTITAVLSGLTFFVDVPDRIEEATISVPSGGVSALYSPAFNGGSNGNPVPLPQITILNAVSGDTAILSAQTLSGFTVQIVNAGSGVSRNINYKSQGY